MIGLDRVRKVGGDGTTVTISGRLRTASLGLLLLAVAGLLLAAPVRPAGAVPAGEPAVPRATVAVVPANVSLRDLDRLRPAAIGLMNPGLGKVDSTQTWLDITQGARAFNRDYGPDAAPLLAAPDRILGWNRARRRAATTVPPMRPGLLATILKRHGLEVGATPSTRQPAILATDLGGRLDRVGADCPGSRCSFDLTVVTTDLAGALKLARHRSPSELLIVISSPPAGDGDQLPVALAGPGFRGLLHSPGTRTPGYVLTTDIAPTVLTHLGLEVPPAMSGQPLEADGSIDYRRLERLEGRYGAVGKRRGAALAVPMAIWVVLAGLAAVTGGRRRGLAALELLCLAAVLLPAVLLLTATFNPSRPLEQAVATLIPALAAFGLRRALPGYRSLAVACGITVLAYGADMLTGSLLTRRAVIGPNPGLGARFYGIGNELESTLMILTSVGTGAALTGFARLGGTSPRRAATVFLAVGAVATVVFAAGRFGADAGAAIVFPAAAVIAAVLILGRPRLAWLAALAALAGLVAVGVIDAISGGQTHFLRSLFDGGGSDGAGEVLRHRLDATADSFLRLSRLPLTVAALALIGVAVRFRRRIAAWLKPLPILAASLIAAAAGSVIGAVANDSGALFIQVGVLYLGLVLGFVFARRDTV